MSGFRGVRVSKFRHIYGRCSRREHCYEGIRITTSAHDSQFCAVNPKFLAIAIDVAGGGAFQVLPLKWTGKIDYHYGRVSGHNGPVTDLKWNPFNDNVIASASDDATVKLWYIPDDGLYRSINQWLCELVGHSRRVAYLEWHPTAENILASVGYDCRVFLWNVSTVECVVTIDCHTDTIYSLCFNRCGGLLATTCKDRILRLIESRTGNVIQEGPGHDGAKASKAVFLGDKQKLITTGFNKASRRQLALWDQEDLSKPLLMQEVDSASGVLFPFYDQDLGILFIAGKGDGNIRYYEMSDSAPYIFYLSEFQSRFPQRGLGVLPKRGLDVSQCEIFRFYKLHTTQPIVEPVSFIVPRKSETFQADLYPQTTGPTPALSAEEWLCGCEREPILISLRSGFFSATSKPVQMKKALSDDGQDKPILVTSDRNNERKFRFLSQVTRPDYREVTQREDYSVLMKEQEFKEQLCQRQAAGEGEPLNLVNVSGGGGMAFSAEDVHGSLRSPPPPPRSPGATSAPNFSSSMSSHFGSSDTSSGHSPQKIRRISASPLSSQRFGERKDSSEQKSSEDASPATCSTPGDEIVPSDGINSPKVFRTSAGDPSRLPKPAVSARNFSTKPENRPFTKPGSIVPGPLMSREQTAHIKPFRISQSHPNTPRDQKSTSTVQPSVIQDSKQDIEMPKLYSSQCKKVRELLDEVEVKERRVTQLEIEVATLTDRLEKATSDAKRCKEDMESLRHEMQWKDERIRYLEQVLSGQDPMG